MPIQFMVRPNHLRNDGTFMPRVINQRVVPYRQILDEIQESTTLRYHDAELAMERLIRVLSKHLGLGEKVETPFGYFRATLHGSFSDMHEEFEPWNQETNHQVDLSIRWDKEFADRVIREVETERVTEYTLSHPLIYQVHNLSRPDALDFHPTEIISIDGVNLRVDPAEEDEGVFWSDGNGTNQRTALLIDNTAKNIKLQVPQIPEGSYGLTIATRLGNHQLRSSYYEETLTVSA